MVTLRSRQMKPLFVAFVVAGVMLGLAVSGALGAEPAGDEQRPINIDVRDMAIGDVLRMLGQAAGVNIIVGQNVTGEIQSLTLRNVSVEAALRRITEAYGYHWRLEDNIYVVSSQPAPEPRVVAAPAVAEPEGPEGQPRGDAGGVPPPPRPQMMEPDTVRPPVTERPQILYEMIPLSYASARDVAAWFGGTVTASPAGLYPQSTRGMASAPGGSGALSSLGAMSASTGMGAPWGLQQFAEPSVGGAGFGGVQPGAIGGGFGAGVRGGVTGATGAVGGTIILPGEMQAPVAIMSHNALLVRGTREELDEFREMLELLDMPAKQVEIATKWIDVSTTVTRALGIDWAVTNGALEIFNLGFA
ncbi:MAG: secretin and TonB N-terminal domain-containing protein, partial [Armatimonadota bacterium]